MVVLQWSRDAIRFVALLFATLFILPYEIARTLRFYYHTHQTERLEADIQRWTREIKPMLPTLPERPKVKHG